MRTRGSAKHSCRTLTLMRRMQSHGNLSRAVGIAPASGSPGPDSRIGKAGRRAQRVQRIPRNSQFAQQSAEA